MVRDMSSTQGINANLEGGAHHESGHIVIAAVQGLRLKPEGLTVDPFGWGLACFYKEPDESDQSRERIIIATLAGFKAENHFRTKRSHPLRNEQAVIDSCDWRESRKMIPEFSDAYFLNENVGTILRKLEGRSEQLVGQQWAAIEALAKALLAKNWEPIKPLKSGGKWSHEMETTAKYVPGKEAIGILAEHGITAVCHDDCSASAV